MYGGGCQQQPSSPRAVWCQIHCPGGSVLKAAYPWTSPPCQDGGRCPVGAGRGLPSALPPAWEAGGALSACTRAQPCQPIRALEGTWTWAMAHQASDWAQPPGLGSWCQDPIWGPTALNKHILLSRWPRAKPCSKASRAHPPNPPRWAHQERAGQWHHLPALRVPPRAPPPSPQAPTSGSFLKNRFPKRGPGHMQIPGALGSCATGP